MNVLSITDRERWDAKYAARFRPTQLAPDEWLMAEVAPLPCGRALELACGLGHNSIWLARQGWKVDAVDVSPIGLSLAAELASANGAAVNWIAADLDQFVPHIETYDLVCVFRFLDRVRLPAIIEQALRPGGRLLYETFTTANLARPESHMTNSDFALTANELPRLFPNLRTISYAECDLADRSVARFVAERPALDD
ncbi:MAG: class I SAM-dependent methyltransferase [Planctomycetaceae bacterium]|nr:class I SAM-dependent methyltransferase [Planctomycetaceae bacterium]